MMIPSCSTQQKYKRILAGEVDSVKLNLSKEESYIPEIKNNSQKSRDTLKIQDDSGKEILILKAVKDEETGEMVATDVIEAATVTARFRNIAERRGKVDLCFQVTVPAGMQDSKWQLRLYPDMFILGDSTRLEPVIITGNSYREDQIRGHRRYDDFVSKIETDTTRFINQKAIDRFMRQFDKSVINGYVFDSDATVDEKLMTVYGLTREDVVNYYTNQYARDLNNVRKSLKGRKYRRYVKVPIVTEGIRLDTVIVTEEGNFVYDYVQTINTRPKLRKAMIKVSGDIYEGSKRIYVIPTTDDLTFYISSVVSFVDNTERYLTKVVERRASANNEVRIDFEVGKSDVRPELGENAKGIKLVKENLASLIENTEFDLDSIIVGAAASPDGSYAMNSKLAQKRSESVTRYFDKYIRHYTDSLMAEAEQGFSISIENEADDMKEEIIAPEKVEIPEIKLTPRSISENWDDLMELVREDTVMTDDQKNKYFEIVDKEKNLDRREHLLRSQKFFSHMKNNMYPKLRTVKFNFYLHRKGMVKDTLHTTILDTVYAKGVQALKDMDYNTAIEHLISYDDYNTAVAYMGLDRNQNALRILEKMERTDQVNYLLAILYSRFGEEEKAVEAYMKSVQQNPSYVYRGNLDPEISVLIKRYGLNQEEEDDFLY
jgi:tetratricopeptide (TPR) repeat protein